MEDEAFECGVRYETYLEDQVENLVNENLHLKSLLESFWTGNVPDKATLDHLVLAKAGRLRLEEKAKVCVLLGGKI